MRIEADSITAENAVALADAGVAAIRGGDVRFDLSAVTRVDSSALALLLAWLREAGAAGRKVEFTGLPADLLSLADLYGIGALIRGGSAGAAINGRSPDAGPAH